MNAIKKYGLIGHPLVHSFSPKYFADKFQREMIENATYDLFPLREINDFKNLIEQEKSLQGLNVTIPYKETIIPYLDELDEIAQGVGAVNTIRFQDGKLKGFNTDVIGFQESLSTIVKDYHNKALILGTGGAAKAVAYALKKMKIQSIFVSRSPKNENEIHYDYLTKDVIGEYLLIVNTTPLGMNSFQAISPLSKEVISLLSSFHLIYDLIYNPTQTKLLQGAAKQGTQTKNGLEMLQLQAEASWRIWNR